MFIHYKTYTLCNTTNDIVYKRYKLNVSSSNISGDIVNYELGTDAPFVRMVTIETPKLRYYKHDSGHHNHDFRKAERILV